MQITVLSRVQVMRRLLIAALASCLAGFPAQAGDLGLYDQFLTGVRAKSQRFDQTEFDNFGNKFIFTPNRLEIVLGDRHRKWMEEKNERLFGNIDFAATLGQTYITPDQVIGYDYHVQHGTGIPFKIFYRARNGDKSLASVIFRDENTAKSFHNTFLLWLNGKLKTSESEKPQVLPAN